MAPLTPRSREAWDNLAASTRRRWRTAFREDAEAAYIRGEHLTRAQRGHAMTPSTPAEALRRPQAFPTYVAKHGDELNELARQRGEAQVGEGERGRNVLKSDSPYTYVIPRAEFDDWKRGEWHLNKQFKTEAEAQLYARRSGAPPGVVIIVETGEGPLPFQVWFGYQEPGEEKPKKARKRKPRKRKRSR